MASQIENPGKPEDYVAGLRDKRDADWHYAPPAEHPPVSSPKPTSRPIKRVDTGTPTVVKCLVAGAILVIGIVIGVFLHPDPPTQHVSASPFGSVQISASPSPVVQPSPVIKYKTGMSKECERAFLGMVGVLDSAEAIASVNNKQLDIFADARQAIVQRDFKHLNALDTAQRNMARELSPDTAHLLLKLPAIQKDIETCRSQQNFR